VNLHDGGGAGRRSSDTSGLPSAAQHHDSEGRRHSAFVRPLDATATSAASATPSSASQPRWVAKGDMCVVPEHGLVVVEASGGRDGRFAVRASDKQRAQVPVDVMRAPREERYAWAPGTKVAYLSASLGTWIDATVLSFNPSSSTYNLDVRQEADPDKVRPR